MRAHKPLWCLSIRTTTEAEEAVRAELYALTGSCPVVRQRPAARTVRVESYFSSRSEIRRVCQRLKHLHPRARELPYEDWAESWKKHFPIQRIGRRILIKPSWRTLRPRTGEMVIELDPGLSFGTGHHATTRFCLKMIEQIALHRSVVRHSRPFSLLDVGTGSGILAIVAAKLGYRPVVGVDNDPGAVRMARANAAGNDVRLRIHCAALDRLPVKPRFDVVAANLLADVILAQRRKLASLVTAGGRLILAGILTREAPAVRRAFWALGLKTAACETKGHWAGLAFRKPSPA